MKATHPADRAVALNRPFQRLGTRAAAVGASAAFALVTAGVSAQMTPTPPSPPTPPPAVQPAAQPAVTNGVDTLFKRFDLNADGYISKSEFEKADPNVAQDFDKFDTDQDGKLSLAEFDAMMKALRR